MQSASVFGRRYDIGKALIFAYSEDDGGTFGVWDGATDMFANMAQVPTGTESPLEETSNAEYSDLTIEDTGPAIHKRYLSGESPTLSLRAYATDAGLTFFSPTGTASSGFSRRPLTKNYTIWVVPEQLFATYDANGKPDYTAEITYVGGVFLKDGEALTTEEQELANLSRIYWKVQADRLSAPYNSENGGSAVADVTLQVLQDFTKPEGCQLVLAVSELDDFEYDLDIEGTGS